MQKPGDRFLIKYVTYHMFQDVYSADSLRANEMMPVK